MVRRTAGWSNFSIANEHVTFERDVFSSGFCSAEHLLSFHIPRYLKSYGFVKRYITLYNNLLNDFCPEANMLPA